MEPRLVLVTGAAGFIGRHVVRRLLETGYRVRAMVRQPQLSPFDSIAGLEIVRGDLQDDTSINDAVRGADAVVHLAARVRDESDSDDINVGGARRLIKACRQADCSRIVNVSTQSAKIPRKGPYARTKAEADRIFHESGLKITSVLPSLVYGGEKSGAFWTVFSFVRSLPVLPVLGDGTWMSAPIHVEDVSAAIVACLSNDVSIGRAYDLGGPDQISFNSLIDKFAILTGRSGRRIHIPVGVAIWIARVLSILPMRPVITISNVLGSNQDTHIDINPARRDLCIDPLGLQAGLTLVHREWTQPPGLVKSGSDALSEQLDVLRQEAFLFARYLLGVSVGQELVERYVDAHQRHAFGDVADDSVQFVRNHPGLLPYLDAAEGLFRPGSVLRQKLLLMGAILEASTQYAEHFLPRAEHRLVLVIRLAWYGLSSTLKVLIGLFLLPVTRSVR